MATVNIYLNFNGNCEEAFNFYKSVFGGEFPYVGRFGEMPPGEDGKGVTEEEANRIMHISLPISNETMLMGSDTGGEWAASYRPGNNFSISVNAESRGEADTLFAGLSAGGQVTMPLADMFWGAYFGMLTDKFGINWMVNYDDPEKNAGKMTVEEALTQLESLGNEKVRAMNTKNGAHENQFGVKMGDIRAIANKIKSDHQLGLALWDTGNIEAQLLGMLVMKPKLLSVGELDRLVHGVNYFWVADWFSSYIVKEHPQKEELREGWMNSDYPWAARAGWSLMAGRVTRNPEGIDIPGLLDRLEAEMPVAPSEVQWTMNTTLAQIGINFPEHRARALAIGEKLGIYRDYPVSKGCTSPFAPIWINEMVSRQNK